jgi:probable rRNA maturation factor
MSVDAAIAAPDARAMPVSMQCELRGAAARGLSAVLGRRAQRMLRALRLERAELSVVLCGDPAMRRLNASFRGLDKPTDVLAFAQGETLAVPSAREQTRVLGDIVLSLPTARRQAREKRREVLDELTMLLAHGLLHLLGIDHRTKTEWRRMQARTDLLRMSAIGADRPVGNRARLLGKPARAALLSRAGHKLN